MIETVDLTDIVTINDIQSIFCDTYAQNNELINEVNNNPYTKMFIYKEEEQIVGVLHFNHIFDRVEIMNVNVLSFYRNRGIASKLMEALLEYSENNKIINITLEVRVNNTFAIQLYQKYGFIFKAIRKGYYNGVDGILMEKEMM